jgi:hypothetical protein
MTREQQRLLGHSKEEIDREIQRRGGVTAIMSSSHMLTVVRSASTGDFDDIREFSPAQAARMAAEHLANYFKNPNAEDAHEHLAKCGAMTSVALSAHARARR